MADQDAPSKSPDPQPQFVPAPRGPLSNYSLSSVCPACGSDTFRLACKVRCAACGFMWDCSEL